MTVMPEPEDQRCTRIAAATKVRCRHPRTRWSVLDFLTTIPLPGPDPQSCWDHLTRDERRIAEEARAKVKSAFDLAYVRANPACWSWEPMAGDEWIRCRDNFPEAARRYLTEADCRSSAMYEWHQGRCAICGLKTAALVEDHDHKTAMVRGWLCRSCNVCEGVRHGGVFEKYRQRNPASICGVQVYYWNPFTQEYAEPAPPPGDPWKNNPMKGIGL